MAAHPDHPTHHGLKDLRGLHPLCAPNVSRGDRFGRMFPELPPLYIDPDVLRAVGDKSGPMKSTGAAQRASSIAVGHIFFGQFIDHDITLDLSSSFARLDRPEDTTDFRTPVLDLDCIYGDGPEGAPFLYWHKRTGAAAAFNGVKLLTGADMPGATPVVAADLFRSPHGRAIIGDPRNDENRIISQLQLGMIRFHNKVADHVHATAGLSGNKLFDETRRLVTWHYQWIVVNDFLKAMCGGPMIDSILGRGRFVYQPEAEAFGPGYGAQPFIPVEFSAAAYRFGHSMIPQHIQVQAGGPTFQIFGPKLGLGFEPLSGTDVVVQWPQLLDLSLPGADRAEKLDAKLAADLLDLPFVATGDVKSLATRNLLRGQAFRLPCGELIAQLCERPESEIDQVTSHAAQLATDAGHAGGFAGGTPLWLYILVEAAEIGRETSPNNFERGEGLGPIGGRIIAETMIGLMELDTGAYLGRDRSWSPLRESDKLGPNGVHSLLGLLTF
jgi:hypothetical protein